ncbi:hypothetical protein BDM02DRAFT_3119302 [Thelephora ganbajun]|uniref:Uncharacterized protein n=1 Tax=Thelephora ganbajun TaxID=370292 RepID=A0ACB6ZA86_THEGA|nr:hypothetical protein BDM02DRAFT_3119302 [Thelephora ganbajun]
MGSAPCSFSSPERHWSSTIGSSTVLRERFRWLMSLWRGWDEGTAAPTQALYGFPESSAMRSTVLNRSGPSSLSCVTAFFCCLQSLRRNHWGGSRNDTSVVSCGGWIRWHSVVRGSSHRMRFT